MIGAGRDDGVIDLVGALLQPDIEERLGDAPVGVDIGAMQDRGIAVGDGERLGRMARVGGGDKRLDRRLARDLGGEVARGLPARRRALFQREAGAQFFHAVGGEQVPERLLVGAGAGGRIDVGRRRPVGMQRLEAFDLGVGAGEIVQRGVIAQRALVHRRLVARQREQRAEQRPLIDARIRPVDRRGGGRLFLGDEFVHQRLGGGVALLRPGVRRDERNRRDQRDQGTPHQHAENFKFSRVNESICSVAE